MVGRTRVGRSPAIAVTVAIAAISVAVAAVFDSDCGWDTDVAGGVDVVFGAVATGSEVDVTAAAIVVAVGDVLSVAGVSSDDESEHPIIARVVRAIRALSRDNVINRR